MPTKSKYLPLFNYLNAQPDKGLLLELTFAEVEAILKRPLPATARSTRAWWANSKTSQGKMWQEAGWLVDDVDFEEGFVVFRPASITYRVTPVRKPQGWTAEQIKGLREHAGWSQQELAKRLGVRQQTVSDWELGLHVSRPSMGKLLQMVAENVGYDYEIEPDENSNET
ncbi:MAG: helix-turn-helix transcriptional regulator [Anaerolineae bacterium]|nr:helix-turn-helix transcriptional regulator [Anaerolineae bacterium]